MNYSINDTAKTFQPFRKKVKLGLFLTLCTHTHTQHTLSKEIKDLNVKKKKTIFKSVLNRRNVEEYFYNISIENCLSNFYKDALTTNYKGKICTIRIY